MIITFVVMIALDISNLITETMNVLAHPLILVIINSSTLDPCPGFNCAETLLYYFV